MISQGFFFIFSKFWLFGLLSGVRQKMSKWQKFIVCPPSRIRNHSSYDCHLWCTCVKWYLQAFFFFFKILIFWVVSGGKEQKMGPNDKNLSFMLYISGTIHYMIWYPRVKYLQVVLSFSKFWFFMLLGGSKGKKWSKMSKSFVQNYISYDFHLWCTCVKR